MLRIQSHTHINKHFKECACENYITVFTCTLLEVFVYMCMAESVLDSNSLN